MFNPEIHHRCTIRLQNHDYTQAGMYFVTICTWKKTPLLGIVENKCFIENEMGQVVRKIWYELPERFPCVEIDEFVVMPNHVHGIINIRREPMMGRGGWDAMNRGAMNRGAMNRGAMNCAPTPNQECAKSHRIVGARFIAPQERRSLGEIVRALKAVSARTIRKMDHPEFAWQRNYYERILRDDAELVRTRDYIAGNPAHWAEDEENPARPAGG